ncbi:MAG: hypothetical protein P8J20_18515 [Novosphingobium sp.]|nr:hypothetical protein [Novosphingobium sp.]
MATVLSIMVLAMIGLLAGAVFLWRRPGGRKQALLMLVLVAVIAGNVAILTLPGPGGEAPIGAVPE